MKEDKLWRDFASLAPESQKQVADFISFLRTRYSPSRLGRITKRTKLAREPFIGIWRAREDLEDSSAWVRQTRQSDWLNRRG